jgi:hypothetical protein
MLSEGHTATFNRSSGRKSGDCQLPTTLSDSITPVAAALSSLGYLSSDCRADALLIVCGEQVN